jgi:hypothetical protein
MDELLLEVVADFAYLAGQAGLYSGDSRADMASIIALAKQFHQDHAETDWGEVDYILETERCFKAFKKYFENEQ